MIKKILALTDFSENALHAALYACKLANIVNAESVTLLHTFAPSALLSPNEMSSLLAPVEATGIFTNYEWAAEQIETIRKENTEELEKLKDQLLGEVNSNIQINCRVESSSLVRAVNLICKQESIDQVVMGIKGRTGIEKALIGSNATKAIEYLNYPLIIVPQGAPLTIPESIVIATNLRQIPEEPLAKLSKLLNSLNIKIFAVHAFNKKQDINEIKKKAAPIQQQLIKYSAEFHFVPTDDIEASINQFAIDHKASMIISLHQVKNFVNSLFHKSITKRLAWHSKIPLMVINLK